LTVPQETYRKQHNQLSIVLGLHVVAFGDLMQVKPSDVLENVGANLYKQACHLTNIIKALKKRQNKDMHNPTSRIS